MADAVPEPQIPRMSADEVKKRLDSGEKIFILDVRRNPDATKIKGAVYINPEKILQAEHPHIPGLDDKNQLIITY